MGVPVVNAAPPPPPVVSCLHKGMATPQPTGLSLKVLVCGLPVMLVGPPAYQIAGCTLPPAAGGPCATAVWTSGATKVQASGLPIAAQNGIGLCAPTATGLLIDASLLQPKVQAL